jgi:hypothetical protein
MYKKVSFRSVPKPGPENRAGFFIDDRFFYVSWRR